MVTEDSPGKNDVRELLDAYTAPASSALYTQEAGQCVRCAACAHRCHIRPGQRGICRMRHNQDGVLYAPSEYVAGLQVDPIEKKPFYHVLPGGRALSFGMLGCNFHCHFCQNWLSSQTCAISMPSRALNPALPIRLLSVPWTRTRTPSSVLIMNR